MTELVRSRPFDAKGVSRVSGSFTHLGWYFGHPTRQ
jgi:hypothetical protein